MNSSIGERLKMARSIAGVSQEALAKQVGVSKMAISKYEQGQMLPNSDVLIELANVLNQPVEFFLRGPVMPISPVYRSRKSMGPKHERAVVAQLQEWLDRYLAAESLYPPSESVIFERPTGFPYPVSNLDDVEDAADALRVAWQLGFNPIYNLTEILEQKGVKVGIVDGQEEFDACLFLVDNETPVIAVKDGLPGDRMRFSLAHELGHLMMDVDEAIDEEKAANRFAGAFLAPRSATVYELGESRRALNIQELHLLKHKYGLSMRAWVYRASDLRIINMNQMKNLYRWFNQRGYIQSEPGDRLPEESPERLTRLVLRALEEDVINERRAGELLGMPWQRFLEQQSEVHGEDLIAVGD